MKNLMKINMVALMVFVFCTIGMAQNEKQRMNREQLAEKQAMHIAQELSFDDATTQRFIEIYCACQQEVWALGPRPEIESATEEEAEQAIKERRNALSVAEPSLTCVKNTMRSIANSLRRNRYCVSMNWNIKL